MSVSRGNNAHSFVDTLKEIFGDKIEIDVDPMQCVALGAAIQTTIRSNGYAQIANR